MLLIVPQLFQHWYLLENSFQRNYFLLQKLVVTELVVSRAHFTVTCFAILHAFTVPAGEPHFVQPAEEGRCCEVFGDAALLVTSVKHDGSPRAAPPGGGTGGAGEGGTGARWAAPPVARGQRVCTGTWLAGRLQRSGMHLKTGSVLFTARERFIYILSESDFAPEVFT